MNILIITSLYPWSGQLQNGIFVHEHVKALKKQGHNVIVVNPNPIYKSNHLPWSDEIEGIKVYYPRYFKMPKYYLYAFSGLLCYLSINKILRRIIKVNNIQIIHGHGDYTTLDLSMRISKMENAPFLVHLHGLDVYYERAINQKLVINRMKKVIIHASKVIGVSEKVLDIVKSKQGKVTNIVTVYNGVNLQRFNRFDKDKELEKRYIGKKIIISVGNLIDIKDQETLIRAVSIIRQSIPDIFCLVIGKGPNKVKLMNLTKELGIDHVIEFIGYIHPDDVRKYLCVSHLFVLPSYYEAFGCVYLEAMACGLPIIACKGQGIEEIISENEGFLIHKQDFIGLAQIVNEILMKPNKLLELGNNALKKSMDFSWEKTIIPLNKIYFEIFHEARTKREDIN